MAAEESARIASAIKRRREELDLTQAQVAARIPGKTEAQQISKWERGVFRPLPTSMEHLANALDVDISYFYAREPEIEETPDLIGALSDEQPATGDADAVRAEISELRADVAAIKADVALIADVFSESGDLQRGLALAVQLVSARRVEQPEGQGRQDDQEAAS